MLQGIPLMSSQYNTAIQDNNDRQVWEYEVALFLLNKGHFTDVILKDLLWDTLQEGQGFQNLNGLVW